MAQSNSKATEASPRLVMAVVAMGVIVGALISPSPTQPDSAVAETPQPITTLAGNQ